MVAAVKMQTVPRTEPHHLWTSALNRAVRFGDFSDVEALLAKGVDVNSTTAAGTTLLMSAAAFGQLKLVRRLVDSGADINYQRTDGFSALLFAVFFGQEDVVRELIRSGADIKAQSRGRTTAHMWASTRGFFDIDDILSRPETPFARPLERLPEPRVLPQNNFCPVEIPVQEKASRPPVIVKPTTEAEYARRENELLESAATPRCLVNDTPGSGKTYSPFSAMAEKFNTRWKYAAVICFAALVGFGTLTALTLKARKAILLLPVTDVTKATVTETTQQNSTSPTQQQAVLTETDKAGPTSQSNEVAAIPSAEPPRLVADKQPVQETTTAQHNRAGRRSRPRNVRVAKVINEPRNVKEESLETRTPAPVTFVTKPPQARRIVPVETPVQPTSPIEGSSTKKKVIQWP